MPPVNASSKREQTVIHVAPVKARRAAGAARRCLMLAAAGLLAALTLSDTHPAGAGSGSPSPILVSQTPLTVQIPAHPQIVLALANSQSMDGDLSGAIMTGSGSLGGALATGLAASSSPANYSVPADFSPPLNPGSGGQAPYTVSVGGKLEDNSASRMNVAKAGITAILNSYMQYADFALMDYATGNVGEYTTWVYYMSPSGSNFSFTSTPGSNDYVANPCYNANVLGGNAYDHACASMLANFGWGSGVILQPYMIIGASSDDPLINDVFYAGSGYQPPICVDGTPNPTNPYSSYGLGSYESGNVVEWYGVQWGASGYSWECLPGMAPTNAGFVPYSPQVMEVERGFGYDATTVSGTTGSLVVPMQSSGQTPTPSSVATAIAAFTPYLQPETNSLSSKEIKSLAEQSALAGLVKGAAYYFSNTNPPATNGCSPARYIVLVTDGLPTKDLSGNSWPPLGSSSAAGYGVTATFNADGSLNSTNDQALTDAIAQITSAQSQGVKTYVIGLGAGVDQANNPQAASTLTAMAIAGGTGGYFPARSPDELTSDMQVILADILATSQSDASATVNTTGLNSNSMAFLPAFTTSDVDQDWTGDVKAFPINPSTGIVNTDVLVWSAKNQLDAQSAGNGWQTSRLIATWDPVAQAGIPFEWTAGTPSSGIATSTLLGQELETNAADPSGQDALDYLRGDAALSIAGGGSYRNRSHILADIIDSAPLYIGAANGPYQSASYVAFEQTYANRAPVIYAGADDGMLHAFNASTGQELFAYIPNGVFANLIQLTNPFYNQQHRFFVDGPAQGTDVQFSDGSWHTVLVAGERAGGNTVFALDVTNPTAITTEAQLASSVLWEFSDPNMGLSFSTPAIAQTTYGASGNNLGFTVFFGNGYNSAAQTPYLYALDPHTGTSLPGTPINLCAAVPTACNSSLPNGLSSVVVTNNMGGVGAAATTLYAGDLQGNLWRVDISNANSLNWVVTLLFKATDPSGNAQPITTTPAVSLNPAFPRVSGTMVYVGTGQLLGAPDLTSTQVQSVYGVYDSGSNATPFTRANLVAQTLSSQVVGSNTLRFVSGQQIALPAQNGWYVDLNLLSGERVVVDPTLDSGALSVITVQPSSDTQQALAVRPPSALQQRRALLARAHPRPQGRRPGAGAFDDSALAGGADRVVDATPEPVAAPPQSGSVAAANAAYRDSWSIPHLWPVVLGITPPPTLESCSISPAAATISLGSTKSFSVIGHYSDGSTQNLTSQASWGSSNITVATIGSNGVASSVGLGSTTITASLASGTITCSANLTVVNPPPPPTLEYCAITPNSPTVDLGTNEQFYAVGHYSNGSTADLSATWSSSTTTVATINASGLAKTLALGSTTINAVVTGGFSCSTTLTVIARPTLTSITVLPPNPTITVGQSKSFTATGHYSDGSTQTLTSVATWTSSNVAVASVSGGLAIGVTAGTVTITASYGGFSASTTLTVLPLVVTPPPVCPGGDVSYLMEFNFAGGPFTTPVFNYNGPSSSMSSIQPANGVLLGNVYASSEVYNNFSGGNNGSGGDVGFITLSSGTIDSIYQAGMDRQRFAWFEIR